MAYNEARLVHDADAHIMETPTWLRDHAEAPFRDRLPVLTYPSGNELRQTGSPEEQQRDLVASFERLRDRHALRRTTGPPRRSRSCSARTSPPPGRSSPKTGPGPWTSWASAASSSSTPSTTGACTNSSTPPTSIWPMPPPGPTTAACSSSARSTPGSWPRATSRWSTPTRALRTAEDAIEAGAAALLVASGCPPAFSPSHLDLFPIWALAQEAGIPVVFHVGGTGELIDPHYFVNGLPIPPRLPRG